MCKRNPKHVMLITALTLIMVPSIFAATAQKPAETGKEKAAPVDASIGRITELSRQVKVASLAKELRDLQGQGSTRMDPAAVSQMLSMPLPSYLSPSAGGPSARVVAGASAPVPIPPKATSPVPPVIGVTGIGTNFSATLSDGRRIAKGESFVYADGTVTAEEISRVGVLFRRCESSNSKCTSHTARVGS